LLELGLVKTGEESGKNTRDGEIDRPLTVKADKFTATAKAKIEAARRYSREFVDEARQNRPKLVQAIMDAFRMPDIRRRILLTLQCWWHYRFIAHVPLPGVDVATLKTMFSSNALLGMLDMFSGGALKNFSIVAMGVYPYITSTIIHTVDATGYSRAAENVYRGRSRPG